MAFFQQDPQCP